MSIARKTAYDYASQAGIMVLSMVAGIFVGRVCLAEGKGVWQAVLMAVTMGTNFSNFGLRAANQYLVGKDPGCARAAHTTTILLALAATGLTFLAAWLLGWFLFRFLPKDFDRSQLPQLWWAALVLPFSLYYFGWGGLMVGLGRIKQYAVFNFLVQLANSLSVLVVLIAGGRVRALLGAWAGIWLVSAAAMAAMLRDHPPRWPVDWGEFRETLSYGTRAFAGNFAGNLMRFFNKAAIWGTGGFGAFSIYTTADGYANKFAFHHEAMERGAFQSMAATTRDDAARLTCRLVRTALFLGLGVWVFGGAASTVLLWLNGPQFIAGIAPLWVMMPAPVVIGGSRMIAMYYSGQLGKPQIPTALAWIGAAINGFLVWRFVLLWGLMGAALATSVSFAIHFVLYVILFRRVIAPLGLGLNDLLIIRREDIGLFRRHFLDAWRKRFPITDGDAL